MGIIGWSCFLPVDGPFLTELRQSGPKDQYELICLLNQTDEALEQLVRLNQHKDRVIQQLARIIDKALGVGWWSNHAAEVEKNRVPDLDEVNWEAGAQVIPLRSVKSQVADDIPF